MLRPAVGLPALGCLELLDAGLDGSFDIVVVIALLVDLGKQVCVLGLEVGDHGFLESTDLVLLDIGQEAFLGSKQADTHLGDGHRSILVLLHQLGNALTMLQLLAGGFVQVRCKLGESCQFTILSQSGTDTTREFLDDLGLSRATNTRYRYTGVNGRTDTRVEQIGFQEDLAVGDGDHVCRYERRNVASLGFDDRQSGQRASQLRHRW